MKVSTPMCCPSRSSLLTGVYVHNHDVYTNNDNCSSVAWREKYEKKTFAAHLYSSGYYTSYIGKYLNKYNGDHIPYGYDEWNGLLMNSRFYNYTVNRNGRRVRHGNDYLNDYYPDLIANDTLDFLSRVGSNEMKRPFLLVSSFPSPRKILSASI
jgi:extracellular sulfatase Sulf